jgi:hypothetical protein
MSSYIVKDSKGQLIDLSNLSAGPIGRAEGAPVARDPRAKAPDQAVDDPVLGLARQASWGLSAGLFALPDLAVKGIGAALGMDEKNVMTLTKLFNRGETAPRNETERYARAIFEGIGGGLMPTGALAFIARSKLFSPIAKTAAGGRMPDAAGGNPFKAVAYETLDFIKNNPKKAFAMDAAFGAAHETLRQAVEENMSDDDPEQKQLFKELMPTAALIGVPLALSALSPTAAALRFGNKKLGQLNASMGELEKDSIDDLSRVYKLPGINLAPKIMAARARKKLGESMGAAIDSPEGRAAAADIDEIFSNYPLLQASGYLPNFIERTMDPASIEKGIKAVNSLPAGSEAQKMLIAQRQKNDAGWLTLYDSVTPDAKIDLQAALNQVKQERQQLFESLATQRTDVTDAELARLSEFYGPLNPNNINGELRGMLQAQMELDVGMRKNMLRKMGLSQGIDKNGVPIPVRDEAGKSLLPASDIEMPALELLKTYDSLLKGRTTMSSEMRKFIASSEPLNTLRKNIQVRLQARDAMEAKLNEELLLNKFNEAFQDSNLARKMRGPLQSSFSESDKRTVEDALQQVRLVLNENPTVKQKEALKAIGKQGALYNRETGDITVPLTGEKESLKFNVKTIKADAKRVADANNPVDINIPEAIDYLEAAARFRNQSLNKYNAVLATDRSSRVTDADQYRALGDKVFNDIEKMVLNNVPRMKSERDAMKMVLDDYRSVYEQRLPLIIGRKRNEAGTTRFATPNEQVLAVAFRSGEDVRNLSAMIGNDPTGLKLLEQGTMDWLQRKAIYNKDGLIDPKKLKDVLQKNQNIVSELPQPVRAALQNEVDTSLAVSARLGAIREKELLAQDTEFDNFLNKTLRPGTDNAIILENALSSPIEMSKLVSAVKGDPDRLDALRRAVFDISKEGALQGLPLKKFIDANSKSLKVLFNEKHLKDLAAVADIQARNDALRSVGGIAPRFESTSDNFKRIFGVSLPGLMTTARDTMSSRISPQGAGITLGVRLLSSMEEELQRKMLLRALTDPKIANALANGKSPEQGLLLLREMQSLGALPRAAIISTSLQASNLARDGEESPIEGMAELPEGVPAARRQETAATMLRKLPPAPPSRGMPTVSQRLPSPPAPTAPPPSMYQMLFPDDPLSQMLQQRQQPSQPVQPPR